MRIYLTQDNKTIILPINPEMLKMSEKSKNKENTVLNLGDVNIPDVRGLNEIKFDSFFPNTWAYYCSVPQNDLKSPISYVNTIMDFKNSKRPVRLVFTGNMQAILKANNNTSGLFLIEDMEWEIKAAEENDIYYSIKLKQYRNYEPKKVTVKKQVSTTKPTSIVVGKTVLRPGEPKLPDRNYLVRPGDNLWNIAKKYYGDGSKYTLIAKANGINTPSLIHVGKKLVIP